MTTETRVLGPLAVLAACWVASVLVAALAAGTVLNEWISEPASSPTDTPGRALVEAPSARPEDTGGREDGVPASSSIATAPGEHAWDLLPTDLEVALGVLAAIPTTTTTPVLAPPVAEARPSPDPAPTPTVQGGDSITEFLACTRAHESDTAGGYQAVSPDGLHHGAYQFRQATWDTVAAWVGRPDLIGVPAELASPADQDLLAAELYRREGNRHWGGRC